MAEADYCHAGLFVADCRGLRMPMALDGAMTHEIGCGYIATGKCTCTPVYRPTPITQPTEMASLPEIKQRLAAIEKQVVATGETPSLIWRFESLMERIHVIEQGQGVLCERLDTIHRLIAFEANRVRQFMEAYNKDTQQIKGALLLKQFEQGKPKARRRK